MTAFSVLSVLLIAAVAVSQRLSIIPRDKEQVVKLGDRATLLCLSRVGLDNCQFDMPSGRSLFLRPDKQANGLGYYGDGFEKGHCGLRINSIKEEHNGVYICTATPAGAFDNLKANMTLIVAKAPNRPELSVSVGPNGENSYTEGDTLFATCRVEQGRPAANISWFIGDERITDGLHMPIIDEYKTQGGVTSVQQNFSRQLLASDNGKDLKCVGEHPLLATNGMNTTIHQLHVFFAPKPSPDFEQFGLVEGEEGKITVVIASNPKPSITWLVDEQVFYENDINELKRFHVLPAIESKEKGPGYWESTLVVKSLEKDDVDRKYTVKALNKFGEQQYGVVISTNPEPRVLDLGVGMIFAIVVGSLLVLILICILVFARARGRWCFSGVLRHAEPGEPEKSPPTSTTTDTGGKDNPAVVHHGSSDYMNNPEQKKPKEDTPV